MSTKRLSKTAIEGGRTRYNKWDRGQSSAEQRAAQREYLGRARLDDEHSDSRLIEKRRKVGKQFDDKLGPMYRWLRAHVGQRWDAVRAKAVASYDSRTTAGRHILYDHLFSSVQETPEPDVRWRFYDFYVDDDGVLRLGEKNRWNRKTWRRSPEDANYVRVGHNELYRWVGTRKVIDYGDVQFWTREPTRWGMKTCRHDGRLGRCPYGAKRVTTKRQLFYKTLEEVPAWQRRNTVVESGRIYERNTEWHCFQPIDNSLAQGNRFTKEEADFWKKLHPSQKDLIIQRKDDKKGKKR